MTETTPLPTDLADRIDDVAISYYDEEGNVEIRGETFLLQFDEPVDPESFCESISDVDPPWRNFGLKMKLADAETDDETGEVIRSEYWKHLGVLLHEGCDGSSDVTLEVRAEWARVYVQDDATPERVAEFLRCIDEEYGIEIAFPDSEADQQ